MSPSFEAKNNIATKKILTSAVMYDFSFPCDLRMSPFAFFMDILLFLSICEKTSDHRSREVQPSSQSDFAENRALKRNWSVRNVASGRIPGVQRGELPDGVLLYVELFDF